MQAEGIKAGDKFEVRSERGRILNGWTATGDAVVSGTEVLVPVKYHDGGDGTRVFKLGKDVPITFGGLDRSPEPGRDPNGFPAGMTVQEPLPWKRRRPAHPNAYWPDQWEILLNQEHPVVIGDIRNQTTKGDPSDNWKGYDSEGRPIGDPWHASLTTAAQSVYDRHTRS